MPTISLQGRVYGTAELYGTLLPTYSIGHELDHVETGIDHLIEQFKNKDTITALLTAWLEPVQDLEDTFFDLMIERSIYKAVGTQLDGLGSLVGEAREGREDNVYREAILIRILLNLSEGTPEQIIWIFQRLTQHSSIELQEYSPAAMTVYPNYEIDTTQAVRFLNYLKEAKLAGVRVDLYYTSIKETKRFDTADVGFDKGRFAGAIT